MPLNEGDILFVLFSRVSPAHPWIVEQTITELWVCKARQKELKKDGFYTCIARCHVLQEISVEDDAE
jgi:hypothetical protein